MSLLKTLFPNLNPIDLFPEAKQAIASNLSLEEQIFVSENMYSFLWFLQSTEGGLATKEFIKAWAKKKAPIEP